MNKSVFDDVAEVYDRVRPSYPDALFDDLFSTITIPSSAKALEIAPGTGQATRSVAQRGISVKAVELGESMAYVARRNLKDYDNVEIVTDSFERTELETYSFDLIYCATALHWIDPLFRYSKPHRLLKSSGYFAIIQTNHISDGADKDFVAAVQFTYDRYGLAKPRDSSKPFTRVEIQPYELDIQLFELTKFCCFPVVRRYSAQEYVELLSTYSPNIALDEETRNAFFADIEDVISTDFGGQIDKEFVMSLTIAKPKPSI